MAHPNAAVQAKWNEATELYGQIKSILDLGELSQEKTNELDKLYAAYDAVEAEATRMEKSLEKAAEIAERHAAIDHEPTNRLGVKSARPDQLSGEQANERKAWNRFLKVGEKNLTEAEKKSLRADSASEGGYLSAPQQVLAEYIKAIDDLVFIRQLGTVYPLDMADSLGVPTIESEVNDPEWTSELNTGTEDTGLKTGKRELKPTPLARQIRLSRKLIRQSMINADALVQERLAYKFAVVQEKAFMTGTGANQPLGVFTASTSGISTARDVATAGASAITGDDLLNTKHALKAAYWNRPNTRWILARQVLNAIRKLKDTTNNYLWSPGLGPGGGLTGGLPPTLIDVPYVVSEYAPSTITTGLYTAIIGDFSFYWIAEAQRLEIQVLNELYAATNQVGYIGRMELDGMPVLEEAFARMRQA